MAQQRCKVFTITPSTGFIVKDVLERLTSSNIKEARSIITVLDLLDSAFGGFGKFEEERAAAIDRLVVGGRALAEGKATPEQTAEAKLTRTRWWRDLYDRLDKLFKSGEMAIPVQAADVAAGLLEKQQYDSTGMRHIVSFIDAVAAAPTEMLETSVADKDEE